MRRLINRMTGGDMWVHESRVDEYLAAGHSLAAAFKPVKKAEAPATIEPEAKEKPEEDKVVPVKKFTAAKRRKG